MSTAAIGTPDSSSRNLSNVSSFSLSPAALTSVVSTPRVGTEFKDRIFVGGFPPSTSDSELRSFFAKFGDVKEAKIIRDHSGTSKGYGFITYATEDEATRVRESCGGFLNADNGEELLDFKGRKLNIGPAIRKASNLRNQNLDVIPQGAVVLTANGTPFVVQNGYAFCATPETYAVTHPSVGGAYPIMYPQQVMVAAPPQFVYPSVVPPATTALSIPQQIPTQIATPQMSQQHAPTQPRVMLSPVSQQQNIVTQQMAQYKSPESPSKMNVQMQTPPPNVNCPNNYARFNYKYVRSRASPIMNGYMRGGYNCPECLDVQNVNDGVYPPGVFTPPPTPITM